MISVQEKLREARSKLWRAQERFNYFPDVNIIVNDTFGFNFNSPATYEGPFDWKEPYLKCFLKADMLEQILDRRAHWNNAEIGCHIRFDRRPNVYMPDVHTLMSFFHA